MKITHIHNKFGKGTILRVDRTTHSVPMVVFWAEDLQTEIFRPLSEIRTINEDPKSRVREYKR